MHPLPEDRTPQDESPVPEDKTPAPEEKTPQDETPGDIASEDLDVTQDIESNDRDLVNLYAKELLTLGLLWHAFHDAVKEGDGERILCHWKFLLVLFKSSKNYNYAKDAVNLLLSHEYLFSERKAAQLLWARTVNTRGYAGCNIPMDLHLNRRLKSILSNLGANISPKSIVKASKSLRVVHKVCETFEMATTNQSKSDKHPYPNFDKDLKKVLGVLEEMEVFVPMEKREHSCFTWEKPLFVTLPKAKLVQAIKKNIQQLT